MPRRGCAAEHGGPCGASLCLHCKEARSYPPLYPHHSAPPPRLLLSPLSLCLPSPGSIVCRVSRTRARAEVLASARVCRQCSPPWPRLALLATSGSAAPAVQGKTGSLSVGGGEAAGAKACKRGASCMSRRSVELSLVGLCGCEASFVRARANNQPFFHCTARGNGPIPAACDLVLKAVS